VQRGNREVPAGRSHTRLFTLHRCHTNIIPITARRGATRVSNNTSVIIFNP